MLTNISVWAVLTLSALLTPPAATEVQPSPAPQTAITSLDDFRDLIDPTPASLLAPKTLSVPVTVKLNFERVKVASIAAPPPPPPKVEESESLSAEEGRTKVATAAKKSTQGATTVKVSPGSAQAEAANQMKAYGWGADQLSCLVSLWQKESNWKYTAENPSSGAYGIPQSLPGSKMASAGADWRTNPATQIKWGLRYIKDRYKTPCGAWGHSVQVGWY